MSDLGYSWIILLCVLLLLIFISIASRLFVQRRNQQEIEYTRAQIIDQERLNKGKNTSNALNSRLSYKEQLDLRRKVAFERLGSSDKIYRDSLAVANGYLEMGFPRNIKRLSNKLRLMLNIAHEKKVIDKIEPDYFGKWVALQEAYPEFITYISRHENTVKTFERLAKEITATSIEIDERDEVWKNWDKEIEQINAAYKRQKHLVQLLSDEKFPLSNKIFELVYFEEKVKDTTEA